MTSRPQFSVVIPSYNYARFLPACLDSVFAQQNAPAFEVIIVDDGSTDDTADVLSRCSDPRLRVVRRAQNLGHAATVSEGLLLARGDVVSRIDPDDRYRPHFMGTAWLALQQHPAASLVYGRAALLDEAGQEQASVTPAPHRTSCVGSELTALLERNFICAPTVAARREAWLAHLPVPGHLAFHDWYFTLLMARSAPFVYVDDVIADYRVHGANHHTKISADGTEERSVLWLLDQVYSEIEADPAMERAKRRRRGRAYAAHYLDFADKYFGFGRDADARRCYFAAFRSRPWSVARPGPLRRWLAVLLSRRLYERAKAFYNRRSGWHPAE